MNMLEDINKALEYTKNKKYSAAEKIYLNLLKQNNPGNKVIYSFLGLLYMDWGKYKKSEKFLEQAYNLCKNQVATESLAIVKDYLNKTKDAVQYYEEIIDTTKNYEVFNRYIPLLIEKKKYKKAVNYAEKFVKIYPFRKESYVALAESYVNTGRLKEATNIALKLIHNYPKYWGGWLWYGLMQEILFNDNVEAEKCFKKVLKYGNKTKGYHNLGVNASKQGHLEKSLQYMKKYYQHSGDLRTYWFNLCNICMYRRQFKKGIKYYANFIHYERLADKDKAEHKLKNIWDRKIHKNEVLFVYGDQGIGDLIMFSRYLPFAAKKFKTVKVWLRDNIFELFKRSFKEYKNIRFYNPENHKRFPLYDKSAIMACLPYYLKADYSEIPFASGYMKPDKKLVEKYKNIINSDKLKVGICWEAGGIGWREQLNRTLNVTFFEPFFAVKDTQIYSLQVNPALQNYKDYKEIIDIGSDFNDFDDTAAALKNLDVLVTIDTSVAHLAGALGVKTLLLLPYCTDWRWFNDTKTTNWYKSVTIFKQKPQESWQVVINQITQELEALSQAKKRGKI